MAGGEGEGPSRRRTARSVETAATGPQAPLRRCSSSTKTKAGEEAPATGPHCSSSKGSSTKRKSASSCRTPRPRATRRKAKEEEAAAAAGAPGELNCRMSNAYVRWVLSLKPMEPPARIAALKRSNPELTPRPGEEADEDLCRRYIMAKMFYEAEESLPATQEWMRGELRSKGYVELDPESARARHEMDAVIEEMWPPIQAMIDALVLEDKKLQLQGKEYQGGDGSDSSDEGEDYSDESDDEDDRMVCSTS